MNPGTCEWLYKNEYGEALPCGKPGLEIRFFLRRYRYHERFTWLCEECQTTAELCHRAWREDGMDEPKYELKKVLFIEPRRMGRTTMSVQINIALNEILQERLRQNQLKEEGRFKYTCADLELSEPDCLMVLMEEVGELCRAILEKQKLTYDRLEQGKTDDDLANKVREEATQVGAIALAIVERSFTEKKTLENIGET